MASKPALYFDMTDIVEHAMDHVTVTGIQRSVIKIVENAVRHDFNREIWGLVKHPVSGKFSVADLSFMKGAYDLDDFATRFELPTGKQMWLAGKLRRYRGKFFKKSFRRLRLHVQWASSPQLRSNFLKAERAVKPSCLTDRSLKPGGVIITLGAGWGTDYVGVSELAKRYGCKVVSFVHDMIPVYLPKQTAFYAKDKNSRFKKWIHFVAKESWFLLCNSYYTKSQIDAYLTGEGLTPKVEVAKFPHEFKVSSDNRDHTVRRDVLDLAQQKYVLCVGTIEVRKNILKLLEAWSQLRKTHAHENPANEAPLLVLAGGKGWGVNDVFNVLNRTNDVDGSVKIVDRPNDLELKQLYKNCQFTVFPSVFEGWGLPIGESLWFGKPVICANNSSMPEVGGRFATYFDHNEPDSLRAALQSLLDHPVQLPQDIRDHLVSWADTAASIDAVVDENALICASRGKPDEAASIVAMGSYNMPLESHAQSYHASGKLNVI